MTTETMTLTKSYSSDVSHPTYIYWKCVDRRYLIRKKSTSEEPRTTRYSRCNWSKSYAVTPSDLECLLTYCVYSSARWRLYWHQQVLMKYFLF